MVDSPRYQPLAAVPDLLARNRAMEAVLWELWILEFIKDIELLCISRLPLTAIAK